MKSSLIILSLVVLLVTLVYADGQIDISYSPYTISRPGSYIVVCDLTTAQDFNCITIATSNVTIDLNGHTLFGPGTTAGAGSGRGISADTNYTNIVVKNGTIRDFRHVGLRLFSTNNQVINIRAYANLSNGLSIYSGSLIKDNIADGNANLGIFAAGGSTVTGNIATNNAGYGGISVSFGCLVTGNTAYNNTGSYGIYANIGSTITGNSVYNNSQDGIYVLGGCTIIGNSVYKNGHNGISADTSSTILDNTCYSNSWSGITTTQSLVKINTCKNNGFNGISVANDCMVLDNFCHGNTNAGIRCSGSGNTVENNLIKNNNIGLWIDIAGNFYASNRASGNTLSNYSTSGAQTDGGTINTALTNVSFYYQPNPVIQQIAGFELPTLHEAEATTPIRSIRW
jgi:parallel beta-helix repeat protein